MSSGSVRPWAYTGLATGAVASLGANIADVFFPPEGWPAGLEWHPNPIALAAAAFWPVALLISTSVLERKRWPDAKVLRVIPVRVMAALALLVVALVVGVISYGHIHALLGHLYESELAAGIGPLGVDGLMVVCSMAVITADGDTSGKAHDTSGVDVGDASDDTFVGEPVGASWKARDTRVILPRDTSVTPAGEPHDTPSSDAGEPSQGGHSGEPEVSPARVSGEPRTGPRLTPVRDGSSRDERIRWARSRAHRSGWDGMASAIRSEFDVSLATAKRDVADAKGKAQQEMKTVNSGGGE